jgi:hypothetical protein
VDALRAVITVATWNVLHRVHAENWGEDVLVRWPQEPQRIDHVAARGAGISSAAVEDVDGLSDHNLVRATSPCESSARHLKRSAPCAACGPCRPGSIRTYRGRGAGFPCRSFD